MTHLVVDAVGAIAADVEIAGLSIDSWLEFLPAQPGPKAKPDDPRPGRARTGLAIRCNGGVGPAAPGHPVRHLAGRPALDDRLAARPSSSRPWTWPGPAW